jgi:thioredoxin reductase
VDDPDAYDGVVVGAGPAGRAAAAELARAGARVALVDESPAQDCDFSGFAVWDLWGHGPGSKALDLYRQDTGVRTVRGRIVILATGQRTRYLPFPGWTLPGVQHLEESDWLDAAGRRVVLAGSGPELLLHAWRLLARGAHVLAVADSGDASSLLEALAARALTGSGPSVAALLGTWATLRRRSIPWLRWHVIVEAIGDSHVQSVRLRTARANRETTLLDVDALCVAFGRQPAIEIAFGIGARWQFDPRSGAFAACRDSRLRLSVPGVFLAGSAGGVAQGSTWAAAEGTLAGVWASVDLGLVSDSAAGVRLRPAERTIRGQRRLARLTNDRRAPVVSPLAWATPETIVCRCERVTLGELRDAALPEVSDPNWIKGPTSAAMGICLGRACETAVAVSLSTLRGEPLSSARPLNVRPPFRPVPLRCVARETPPPERIQQIPGA